MEHCKGNDVDLPLAVEVGVIRRQFAERIPWHAHAGCQLLFVLRGTTAYEFKRRGVERVDLPGGCFLVIAPGMVHRAVQEVRPPCELCYLVLTASAAGACRNTPLTPADLRELMKRLSRATLAVRPIGVELRRVVSSLVRAVQVFSPRQSASLARARIRTLVCEALLEAAGQLGQTPAMAHSNLVSQAEAYLRRHLGEELQMADVAKQLGATRARLFEQFKRGTGMTPNDYLLRARIERARELLVKTEKSVTDIAFETGFGSSQYFSTVFRRYTRQTPLQFRQAGA